MLALLRRRCERKPTSAGRRLQTHHTEALSYLTIPSPATYDLVVTHFFLDCLTQPELEQLVAKAALRLAPGALWIISDFRIPSGAMRLPTNLLIRGLYLAFRILTGLRVDRLPDHATALARAGLIRVEQHISLGGILFSELWRLPQSSPSPASYDQI
jgi:hypothetical protein